MSHLGLEDARVTLFFPPVGGAYERRQLEHNGVSGELLRVKPDFGQAPSAGGDLLGLIRPLHFGDFADLLSKFVWVALGFASCYVILSGFALWVERRREEAKWRVFERFALAFGSGAPIAALCSAAGHFLATPLGLSANTTVPLFFCVASVVCLMAAALSKEGRRLNQGLLLATAILCLLLPLLRVLCGGVGWREALSLQNPSVVMIDCLLVGFGLFALRRLRKALRPTSVVPPRQSSVSMLGTVASK